MQPDSKKPAALAERVASQSPPNGAWQYRRESYRAMAATRSRAPLAGGRAELTSLGDVTSFLLEERGR
jgi:hypothetical protein